MNLILEFVDFFKKICNLLFFHILKKIGVNFVLFEPVGERPSNKENWKKNEWTPLNKSLLVNFVLVS